MPHQLSLRPRRALALALAAVAFAAGACKDDTTGPDDDHEIHVESMRLTIAGQTVTIASNGDVTPSAPVTLGAGTHNITSEFLTIAGIPDPGVTAAEFQLDVRIPEGAPVTFTRSTTNPFAGTLTVTGEAANVEIRFALFHIEEEHEDFGPFPVTFVFTN